MNHLLLKVNPFNGQCSSHIETSQLICRANQLTGFYVRGTLAVKRLKNARHKNAKNFSFIYNFR